MSGACTRPPLISKFVLFPDMKILELRYNGIFKIQFFQYGSQSMFEINFLKILSVVTPLCCLSCFLRPFSGQKLFFFYFWRPFQISTEFSQNYTNISGMGQISKRVVGEYTHQTFPYNLQKTV